MKTSYPVFWIPELTCDLITRPFGGYYESRCTVYLDLMNTRGEVCKRAVLFSRSQDMSQEASVLKCVENLLNGNYEGKVYETDAEIDVRFDASKTIFYFEGIEEPWYSFFHNLIQNKNWKVQSGLRM